VASSFHSWTANQLGASRHSEWLRGRLEVAHAPRWSATRPIEVRQTTSRWAVSCARRCSTRKRCGLHLDPWRVAALCGQTHQFVWSAHRINLQCQRQSNRPAQQSGRRGPIVLPSKGGDAGERMREVACNIIGRQVALGPMGTLAMARHWGFCACRILEAPGSLKKREDGVCHPQRLQPGAIR
jgi:hypothetical protein